MRILDGDSTSSIVADHVPLFDAELQTQRPPAAFASPLSDKSEEAARRNCLFANVSPPMKTVSLFGYYMPSYSKANIYGSETSIQPYDLHVDYGRASNDIHNRVFFGGCAWSACITEPLRSSPLSLQHQPVPLFISPAGPSTSPLVRTSTATHSSTTARLRHRSQRPSVYHTKRGNFDADRQPGQTIIPITGAVALPLMVMLASAD